MAAFETQWVDSMSPPSNISDNARGPYPPTVAAFSPTTTTGTSLTSRQRSSSNVIVNRKSPLLVATPPPVTRALAHSHPFLLPLNTLAGLLTWSTGDGWASFLLVAGFWAVVLYSDTIIMYAGPLLMVGGLILGLYSRRYSPLSSTGVTGEKLGSSSRRPSIEVLPTRHQKSLDEIVETMREFTTRCNILLGPLREMTDFLSTQSSATSVTTRPALTSLLIRIICVTPIWILLTLPPFYIITTRRVVLSAGTIILTYHSSPARVFRELLWRSLTIRRICALLTGLEFSIDIPAEKLASKSGTVKSKNHATTIATSAEPGVRFTFIVYENQRRWLGIGWTYSLFPHERSAWTDDHLNAVPPRDSFELPDAHDGNATWRWVEGSQWRIESGDGSADGGGWIYYDNKWQDGRRIDSWSRYTRRRQWYRDAELVESSVNGDYLEKIDETASIDTASTKTANGRKRRWFNGTKSSRSPSMSSNKDGDSVSLINSPMRRGSMSTGWSSRPGGLQRARTVENNKSGFFNNPIQKSVTANTPPRTTTASGDGDADSQKSARDREIEDAQNRLDKWGARASGGTERAERELGLGDDVNMGLS